MSEQQDVTRRVFLASGGIGALAAFLPPSANAAWTSSAWTAPEKANVKVVTDFLAALEAKDATRLVAQLTNDAFVRMAAHMQTPPLTGHQPVSEALGKFFATSSVTFKVLETVAAGPIVVNKRIDRIAAGPNVTDLHYLGVFFLKDGKIKEWSDYEVAPATPVKPGQPL